MKALLGFMPFLVFALLSTAGYSNYGLLAGTATAALWIARDTFVSRKSPKILDMGTFVLFAALTIFTWTTHLSLSVALVRIVVDSGLLLIVLLTIMIGKPFTLEYAKESVPPSLWADARFIRGNVVISAAWAVALFVAVLADMAMWRGIISARGVAVIIFGAFYAAMRFTHQWHPDHQRAQAVAQR
ncbi:hypothetical protein ACFFJT_14585 [Dyella flava]|uniref:Intracellular septation protein A n=1 Tax=Dyella flava TaxID=1920170 RepID=A0ABS2K0N0_9GAMM|nr:hypothetical protein [Dyella flava]MBM7123863.1 hypothetical protein [Dyella flava]GLQ52599.1 hypothetical protein GCM10010872_40480 [Dyella flava]